MRSTASVDPSTVGPNPTSNSFSFVNPKSFPLLFPNADNYCSFSRLAMFHDWSAVIIPCSFESPLINCGHRLLPHGGCNEIGNLRRSILRWRNLLSCRLHGAHVGIILETVDIGGCRGRHGRCRGWLGCGRRPKRIVPLSRSRVSFHDMTLGSTTFTYSKIRAGFHEGCSGSPRL